MSGKRTPLSLSAASSPASKQQAQQHHSVQQTNNNGATAMDKKLHSQPLQNLVADISKTPEKAPRSQNGNSGGHVKITKEKTLNGREEQLAYEAAKEKLEKIMEKAEKPVKTSLKEEKKVKTMIEKNSEAEKKSDLSSIKDKRKVDRNNAEKVDVSSGKETVAPLPAAQNLASVNKGAEKAKPSPKLTNPIPITNDVEMRTPQADTSPLKCPPVITEAAIPAATSTPGKKVPGVRSTTSELDAELAVQSDFGRTLDRSNCARNFAEISGRRSIRPVNEFTSSPGRQSYRRINTELDVSSISTTSLDVTVGSEVPNNASFSFFGRGRKRDRPAAPTTQNAIESPLDGISSPPKRARLDMHGFFTAVSSPLSVLRSRFSKTSIQSSTPFKQRSNLAVEEVEAGVQNVTGVPIHVEIPSVGADVVSKDVNEGDAAKAKKAECGVVKADTKCALDTPAISEEYGSEVTGKNAVIAADVGNDSSAEKNKRCNIM